MSARIRKFRVHLTCAALAVVYLLPFLVLKGHSAAYIKFEGIDGESTDKTYEKSINVLSWSWGASAEAPIPGSGGSGSGKADFSDFSFVHDYDRASPLLALKCFQGKSIPSAELKVNRSINTALTNYLLITFTNVFITSLSPSGTGDSTDRPYEQVSFNYEKIEFEYTQYDVKGTKVGTTYVEWDRATNTGNGGTK